jgi:hypothetical protein
MRRLVQLIADYEPGELAFAEQLQRLELGVPDCVVNATVVAPGDTLAAGLCVAQLALSNGPPGWMVVHDVGAGERVCVGRTHAGAIVVGPDAGWSWSFVVDEVRELFYLDVGSRGARRPIRDLVALAVRHAVARHPHAVTELVPRDRVPRVPACAIAWIDRAGNLTTTLSRPPAEVGERLRVDIGDAGAVALVVAAREAVPDGELGLAPCTIGWPTRDGSRLRLLELGVQGGSAAELFDHPATGTPIAFAPLQPRAAA